MGSIIYLANRIPYPPNTGAKLRSYHLLKHLAAKHRVYLGTFIDDPDDEQYVDTLRMMCAGIHVARLSPRAAKLRSLNGLLANEPLTVRYYRDASLQDWVIRLCRQEKIDAAVVSSSPMAQYVEGMERLLTLIDFVDVESAKWTQYAATHRGPKSWIRRREGERLLAYERHIASHAARSFFVTENEVALFRKLAPECAIRVEAMGNGVDAEYFKPAPDLENPFAAGEVPVVFVGSMDSPANGDAVKWFAGDILPRLIDTRPDLRFTIVGRRPSDAVRALAGEYIRVTGTVPDVRPYLQHAALVVAPMRISRGIQNKVLEAMSMGKPVVASAACSSGIDAERGRDLLVAERPASFVSRIDELLADPVKAKDMGDAARRCILARHAWEAHMSRIDRYLDGAGAVAPRLTAAAS